MNGPSRERAAGQLQAQLQEQKQQDTDPKHTPTPEAISHPHFHTHDTSRGEAPMGVQHDQMMVAHLQNAAPGKSTSSSVSKPSSSAMSSGPIADMPSPSRAGDSCSISLSGSVAGGLGLTRDPVSADFKNLFCGKCVDALACRHHEQTVVRPPRSFAVSEHSRQNCRPKRFCAK